MPFFLIGAVLAFKWMHDKGIFNGAPASARPGMQGTKGRNRARRPAPPPPPSAETLSGEGEDWIDPNDMVIPGKAPEDLLDEVASDPGPVDAPKHRRREDGPVTAARRAEQPVKAKAEEKKPLPPRPAGKGSFDDVMEAIDTLDSLDGVGVDEIEDLNGKERLEGDDEEA